MPVTAGRVLHCLLVLGAVCVYTVVVARGMSSAITQHLQSSLRTELDNNPAMRDDFLTYRQEQERLAGESHVETKNNQLVHEAEEMEKKLKDILKKLHEMGN